MAPTDTTSAEDELKPGDEVIWTFMGSEQRGVLVEDTGLVLDGDHIVGVSMGEGEYESRFQTFAENLRRAPAE